jgi:hypothetical protein
MIYIFFSVIGVLFSLSNEARAQEKPNQEFNLHRNQYDHYTPPRTAEMRWRELENITTSILTLLESLRVDPNQQRFQGSNEDTLNRITALTEYLQGIIPE